MLVSDDDEVEYYFQLDTFTLTIPISDPPIDMTVAVQAILSLTVMYIVTLGSLSR